MINLLKQKRRELEKMLSTIELRPQIPTTERLEIVTRNGKALYYKCSQSVDNTKKTKIYIRHSDIDTARQLAQSAYDKKALRILKAQHAALTNFLNTWDEDKIKALYSKMAPERRALISPAEIDDETYAKYWQNKQYEPGTFSPDAPEIFTNKGERVRSKSEKIIADELNRLGIPYHYECPFTINGKTVRPDFYILNIRTRETYIIELLGMLDNPDYARKNVWKINSYTRQGFVPGKNLLILYETSDQPIDMQAFRVLIDTFLR